MFPLYISFEAVEMAFGWAEVVTSRFSLRLFIMKGIMTDNIVHKNTALEIPGGAKIQELTETAEGRQELRRLLAVSSMYAAFRMVDSADTAREKNTSGWENIMGQASTAINSALRALKDIDAASAKQARKKIKGILDRD